jgi:preprotein translocase subunit SecG
MQVKGMSGAGLFGGGYSTFRTRRGFERTLFRGTIVFMFVFVVIALLAARFPR